MAQKKYAREGYLEENYHYFHLRDSAGAERDFHFHEFDKIVLLLSGRVDYAMESIVYTLRPWDILLVPHHTIHKALIDKSAPYERIILYLDRKYFDRLMPDARLFGCFDRADERARYLLAPDEAQRAPLETLLGQLEEALRGGQFGAEAMCDALIVQLLVLLGRLGFSDAADKHAEQVHAYIRQRRLMRAAHLIREGMSAARAAEECGFADYSAFHRAFTAVFGISPGRLKK